MADEKKTTVTFPGIGFPGMLAILFIGLKLGGVIDWSWWWVFAPLWIPILVGLVVVAFVISLMAWFNR